MALVLSLLLSLRVIPVEEFYWPGRVTCGLFQIFRGGGFSLTAKVTLKSSDVSWWLTSVYGPQSDLDKVSFLDELRMIRSSCSDSWMVCGDFNLIYKAEDKNNSI